MNINLKPITYKFHMEDGFESLYIECLTSNLIIDHQDIRKNKELFQKLSIITLHLEKKDNSSLDIIKNSIQNELFMENIIGTLRENVYDEFDVQNSSLDAHLYVENIEFEFAKKCILNEIKINEISIKIDNGLDYQVNNLKNIFYWSEKEYLKFEWKMKEFNPNILPVFKINMFVERKESAEVKDSNEEVEKIKRDNFKEDLEEVIDDSIFSYHTQKFNEMSTAIENIKTIIDKIFKLMIVIIALFFISILIEKF